MICEEERTHLIDSNSGFKIINTAENKINGATDQTSISDSPQEIIPMVKTRFCLIKM